MHRAALPADFTHSLRCWPLPPPLPEDEGVVLVVLVAADGTAALVALDGQSLQEVARASLPWSLTVGFHGCFVPAA